VVTEHWVQQVLNTMSSEKYRESVRKMSEEGLGERVFLPELARQKRETLHWLKEGRLQRPVQVIWGYNDRTAVLERGVELFQMLAATERSAQLHVINAAGHFTFREQPAQFNALLGRFCDLHS
jgi:pimeloyl-ACP methyl ester carboxylesterase